MQGTLWANSILAVARKAWSADYRSQEEQAEGSTNVKAIRSVRGMRVIVLTPDFYASPVLAIEAPTPAPHVTAPQMINAFESTFGVHPGQPRSF